MTTDAIRVATLRRAWLAEPLRRKLTSLVRSRGRELFVVGGAVRDVLLAHEVGDWDVAGYGMIELARSFAEMYKLRMVTLHEDFPTVRVILQHGSPGGFLDFVELRAPTIVDDLRARDFTINAMAWDVRGADHLVDPTGGAADLDRRLIRSPSRDVLACDPLRVLRGFRFMAQLGFGIEPETGRWLGELAPRLWEVPGPRIGQELIKLFAARHAADAMQAAEEVGALEGLLPPLAAMRGVTQGDYHHLDVLGHSLLTLHEAERIINDPEHVFPQAAKAVRQWLADPDHRAAVRMAALFHDVAKPQCRTVEDGQTRFIGHADEGAAVFLELAQQVSLPMQLRQQVARMIRLHMRPLELANSGIAAEAAGRDVTEVVTIRAIRRLMHDARPAAIGLLVLAAADRSACRGPASHVEQRERIYEIFDDMLVRYLDWLRRQRERPSLIDGRQLMDELGIEEGPLVGELLDRIAEAYADREITTREQALALARKLLGG